MPIAAGDWPELGEELARKSLEVLQDRVFEFENGTISKDTLIVAVNTLVSAIIGLAPMEVVDLIYEVRKKVEAS